MDEPAERYFGEGASRLCYFEWGDPADPAILLIHATGFHGRCWDRVVEAFPDGHHVIAVDMLGHGRSAKPDTLSDWQRAADALAELIEGLDLRFDVAAGHSMGGFCVVQIAAQMPERFSRLVLVDPVIMDPAFYDNPRVWPFDHPSEHPVAKRRNRFESPEAMVAHFRDRSPYDLWDPRVLDDYCRYGLLPAEDGEGYVLACPPLLEASMYMGSLGTSPYEAVAKVTAPVTVLRAPQGERDGRMDFTKSPTWEGLADAFANGRDVYLPDLTHFMPMQEPGRIAGFIAGDVKQD